MPRGKKLQTKKSGEDEGYVLGRLLMFFVFAIAYKLTLAVLRILIENASGPLIIVLICIGMVLAFLVIAAIIIVLHKTITRGLGVFFGILSFIVWWLINSIINLALKTPFAIAMALFLIVEIKITLIYGLSDSSFLYFIILNILNTAIAFILWRVLWLVRQPCEIFAEVLKAFWEEKLAMPKEFTPSID